MFRFGLCCIFVEKPVRFRTTTAKTLLKLSPQKRLEKAGELCLFNLQSLLRALHFARELGIGAFRILSPLFPRFTHPEAGYTVEMLPNRDALIQAMTDVRVAARSHDIRLSFHPDQFVVLNSHREKVVQKSIAELEYQAWLAEQLGAETINIHVGGVYGDKIAGKERLVRVFPKLSTRCKRRLTLENDDISYAPVDVAPICERLHIPFVYDVHHHRCLPDGLSVEEATGLCVASWVRRNREPWFHISSPRHGWSAGDPKPHSDFIDVADVPEAWRQVSRATVDVEAKAKEKAVVKLMQEWPFP